MTMGDIRFEGRAGRLAATMTAVVVDGPKGKEYRVPTNHEREAAEVSEEQLQSTVCGHPVWVAGRTDLPNTEALSFQVFSTIRIRHMAEAVYESAAFATQCASSFKRT